MTVAEIKEGLRLCADRKILCDKCPYEHVNKEVTSGCASKLLKDALDLIEFAEKVIEEA